MLARTSSHLPLPQRLVTATASGFFMLETKPTWIAPSVYLVPSVNGSVVVDVLVTCAVVAPTRLNSASTSSIAVIMFAWRVAPPVNSLVWMTTFGGADHVR